MGAYDRWEEIEVAALGARYYQAYGCQVGATYLCESDRARCERYATLSSAVGRPRGIWYAAKLMPTLIEKPSRIEAAGTKPKLIDEYVGRANSGESRLSVAHMRSPGGWEEPGQKPEFDEYTLVLKGAVQVEHEGGTMTVEAGQAVLTKAGEWIRYSTPGAEGAEYIAICLPAFSPDTVHRDE